MERIPGSRHLDNCPDIVAEDGACAGKLDGLARAPGTQ